MLPLIIKLMEWWLKRNYGKCPDYVKGCASCDAWHDWGKFKDKYFNWYY